MTRPDLKHISNEGFPNLDNVNVYKWDNTFDYSRWSAGTKIKLCNVPWRNREPFQAVKFTSDTARDKYFAGLTGNTVDITLATRLDAQGRMRLPLPFDEINKYNYVVADYGTATSTDKKIAYETGNGIKKYFYFIDEIANVKGAPNMTEVVLSVDWWTTVINSVSINYMMLERGHAPLKATNATTYLKNPLKNNKYLLAPDVNFGDARIVQSTNVYNISQQTYCVIATTAALTYDWTGDNYSNWNTPANPWYQNSGVPSVNLFAIDSNNLNDFLTDLDNDLVNFKQTIKGIFFAPQNLISLNEEINFNGWTVYGVYTNGFQEVHNFFELDKTLFGYNSNYAEYAKLYTTPYARIEVTDQRGNITNINVEDTSGILNVQACMSLAFPAIGVSCFINGSGGTNVSTLAFQNLDDHFVDVMGKWYDTLIEFDIPIFSVVQANEKTDYFQNYYNRIQAKNNYNTALTNAKENANTTLTNANDSAMTAYNNAAASANNAKTNTTNSTNAQVSNAALQITANNVQNSASNLASTDNTATGNGSIQAMQAYDAGVAWAMQNAESEYATSTAITSAVGGTIAGAASGAMSAGLGGAVAGLIGGVVGGVTNGINTHWAINASADKVQASIDYAQEKVYSQQQTNETINYNNTTACTANTNAANTYTDGATWNTVNATNTNATNTQNTTIANAQRTYNITTGNAQRTYDTSIGNANRTATNAQNAIDNGANQARLSAPNEFGLNTPTVSTANMPMMLQANVVTQNEGAIEQAAAQFARYGYMLNQPWRFTTFNIMKNFTYWKTSDVWLTSSNTLIESARKQIENMLQSGVTVWQNPEKIGTVNVYDN